MGENDVPKHHVRQELCTTRPAYRDGRKLTAVKVYTVHQESRYLLVQNVSAVGAKDQLAEVFSAYGAISELYPLDDYPAEKFTEVYLIKYQRIQSARLAKRKLDDHSFYGASLHVCYAPEYETVQETREKLQDRRKIIAAKVRQLEKESEPSKGLQTSSSRPAGVHSDGPLSLPPSQQRLALPPAQPQPLPPTLTQSPHMIQPQAPTPPPPPTHPPHPQPPTHLTHRPPPTHPPHPQPPTHLTHRPPPTHPSLPPLLSVAPPSLHSPSTAYAQSPAGPLHFQSAPSGPHAGTHGTPPQAFLHPNQRADGLPADQGLEESQQGLDNFVFRIPPPPMPGVTFDARQYRTPHFSRKDYGFAWVPSANSAFPPGYDPRLPEERSSDDRTHASEEGGETTNEAGAQLVPSASGAVVFHEHAQPKPKEPASKPPLPVHSGGGEKIIIKQYKPRGPPPRFVPRQVQEKKDSNSRPADANVPTERSKVKAKEDEMNREIRREAFRLGNDQGPSLPTDPEMREQLLGKRPLVEPKVEASVLTSVKAIRKRLSKFISETVQKKLKTNQGEVSENGKPSGD